MSRKVISPLIAVGLMIALPYLSGCAKHEADGDAVTHPTPTTVVSSSDTSKGSNPPSGGAAKGGMSAKDLEQLRNDKN